MKFKSLLVEAMMYLITDIDEEELMGDLDALEAWRQKVMGCLHIRMNWKKELTLPPAPTGHAAPAVPAGRVNQDNVKGKKYKMNRCFMNATRRDNSFIE
ncbi:unnamed protein product [Camellia sinensis]